MKRTKKQRKSRTPATRPARDKLVRQIAEAHLAPVRGGESTPCHGCGIRCSGASGDSSY